ncbi:hypothetical protein NJ76_15480, partial [Rhodococcus sp. IITR03]
RLPRSADGQVKLRGLRIELGEIERRWSRIRTSRRVRRRARRHARRLCGAPGRAAPSNCGSARARRDDPARPHGPGDRDRARGAAARTERQTRPQALPDPQPTATTRREPETSAEAALCELFAEALRLDVVGPDDDFFALGGDSIVSMQVVTAARRKGIEFGPREIFRWRTPAGLAAVARFAERPNSRPVPSDDREP